MGRIYEGATLIIAVVTRVRDEDGLAGVGSTCAFVDKRKLAWELEMVCSRLDVSRIHFNNDELERQGEICCRIGSAYSTYEDFWSFPCEKKCLR